MGLTWPTDFPSKDQVKVPRLQEKWGKNPKAQRIHLFESQRIPQWKLESVGCLIADLGPPNCSRHSPHVTTPPMNKKQKTEKLYQLIHLTKQSRFHKLAVSQKLLNCDLRRPNLNFEHT